VHIGALTWICERDGILRKYDILSVDSPNTALNQWGINKSPTTNPKLLHHRTFPSWSSLITNGVTITPIILGAKPHDDPMKDHIYDIYLHVHT
jgi:hypothetical protein